MADETDAEIVCDIEGQWRFEAKIFEIEATVRAAGDAVDEFKCGERGICDDEITVADVASERVKVEIDCCGLEQIVEDAFR